MPKSYTSVDVSLVDPVSAQELTATFHVEVYAGTTPTYTHPGDPGWVDVAWTEPPGLEHLADLPDVRSQIELAVAEMDPDEDAYLDEMDYRERMEE